MGKAQIKAALGSGFLRSTQLCCSLCPDEILFYPFMGCAVSVVKAGVRMVGPNVGLVRALLHGRVWRKGGGSPPLF